MKGPTAKLGQRGSAPLLSFATEPPGNGETLSTPALPLHEAGPPWSQRRGVACVDIASLVGIGQRKCPPRKCSHLDRGNRKSLAGYSGCWCTSSLQPHLALASCVDAGQKVHLRPPFWLDCGSGRWSPYPGFLPLLHL